MAEMREWLEENVRPVLATLDRELRSGFGMDFGRSGDLSVLLPFQVAKNLRRHFVFALELSNCPFDQQREALFYIGERLPRLFAGKLDARGNGQYLAEKAVQKWGPGAHRGGDARKPGTATTPRRSRPRWKTGTAELVRDADHLDDLRAFQVIDSIPLLPDTCTKGQDGQQRHGDAGVAYLLAYAASRAEGIATTEGFESAPRIGSGDDIDYGSTSRECCEQARRSIRPTHRQGRPQGTADQPPRGQPAE